jgi:hypothetical protein
MHRIRSQRTRSFRRLFARLPAHVQQQIRASYRLFRSNPYHPSLGFERIFFGVPPSTQVYATRIGRRYRAMGRLEGNTIKWFYVGSHEEYNRFVS